MIQAMCLRPEILRAFAGFGGAVYPGGLLERRVKEPVIISASKFTDPELVELTFLIGYITMLNLFNNLLGVRYHGEYGALREALA